jgi:hypothetical protein
VTFFHKIVVKQHLFPPQQIMPPLHLVDIRQFLTSVRVGDVLIVTWATLDDPTTEMVWECVVQSKPTANSATFTSKDADEDAPPSFDLPDLSPPGAGDEEKDEDLQYVYHSIVAKARHAKKGMGEYCQRSLHTSKIVAWKFRTWLPMLNMEGDMSRLGYELVIGELRRQLQFPERVQMAFFTNQADHDRCALGEALMALVQFLAILEPSQQTCPEVERVLQPILRRLCEHRVGDNATGADRSRRMEQVRNEFLREDFKNDRITQVMAGITPPKN